ncbi:MAG TPA: phosphatidate cytidylyltransferase, partial [Solirubrobacteraceae bacterium]|nr:phosphatidate cytidylyltransferase [Solirubrobacteraceae bacterium]
MSPADRSDSNAGSGDTRAQARARAARAARSARESRRAAASGERAESRRAAASGERAESRRAATGGERAESRRAATGSERAERERRRPRSDLFSRVLVAVPASVIAIVFVDLGGLAWALFMIAAGALCMNELYGMLARWRPSAPVGFAALAAMVIAARYGSERSVLELAVATLPVAFLVIVARGQRGQATVSIAGTLLGVYWLAFAFAHAELLRRLPHGNAIIIDVLIGTFLGDTAAYFGGRLFGRRALAPSISPNKTLEGLFCGMLIAILSIFVAGLYQTWLTQGQALLLGLAVAVLGPIGDLFESLVKRDAGHKDSGNLFGAHGGALDRLDAVI